MVKETVKKIEKEISEYQVYCDSCGKLIKDYGEEDPRDDYNLMRNSKQCCFILADNYANIAKDSNLPVEKYILSRHYCSEECYKQFHDAVITKLREIGFKTMKEKREEEELRRSSDV